MPGGDAMTRRRVGRSRWFATQVVVSVAAAACVAALFSVGHAPREAETPVAGTGKSLQRVGDGVGQATVLRYDPQEQAALASMARFTPTASPVVAAPAMRAPAKSVTVLPPPRPVLEIEAPAPVAATPQAAGKVENWSVAGMEIPGSATVRRHVPSGDDLLRGGNAAWTAGAKAVRTVATLGGLL